MKGVCARLGQTRYTHSHTHVVYVKIYTLWSKTFSKDTIQTLLNMSKGHFKILHCSVAKTENNSVCEWLWRLVWAHWLAAPNLAVQTDLRLHFALRPGFGWSKHKAQLTSVWQVQDSNCTEPHLHSASTFRPPAPEPRIGTGVFAICQKWQKCISDFVFVSSHCVGRKEGEKMYMTGIYIHTVYFFQ